MNGIPTFKFAIREDLQDTGNTFLPTRGTPKATGWDVKAAFKDRQPITVFAGRHIKIPLGFRTFAPEGWWYELKPRSSTFGKKNLHSLYGTIDEDYEGQLIFACQYIPDLIIQSFDDDSPSSIIHVKRELESIKINFGDAIGQIIPVRRQEMIVETISNKEYDASCKDRAAARGDGGFGSTDKKETK